ncbi:MAG: hypothetical protein A2X56_12405 [Nitrospirae bacterium GWC2_57_13]|nr:MAG: hypothetical protein A2X56_12405 [Nitrospirae bacterium GWC2_57_13]OGW46112.1 MAG: hypothetical protein A2X57_03820 [Nitrospirae bacterium GWD2_57_8]
MIRCYFSFMFIDRCPGKHLLRTIPFLTAFGIALFYMAFLDLPLLHASEPDIRNERIVNSAPFTGQRFLIAQNNSESNTTGAAISGTSDGMTFWEWLWDYLYTGASLTVGVGTRQAELEVTRKSDDATGKIVQRDEEAYFISYSTRPSLFRNSKFGYTFLLNYTTFKLDQQEISKDVYEDLGTRIRGKTAYVVPSFFYQWGQHEPYAKFVRLGIGIGLGVAKYQGDIIMTDALPYGAPISISNGSYDLKAAAGFFLDARYRFIGLNISSAGPSYKDDTYKYDVRDIAVYLGFTYYF